MQNMGMNDTSISAGACSPMPPIATMKPTVVARLKPGAVELMPITKFEMNVMAFFFSAGASVSGATAVADSTVSLPC
jgi:hypothetical protein